jgi:hypothetical protein
MRTLKFIVEKQIIRPDPNCDFSGLMPGTEGYVKAKFAFSPEWRECVKVAAFWSVMGKEYPPQLLQDGCSCMIPAEALKGRKFKVQVIGKHGDLKMTTNKMTVSQNGGKE